MVSMEDAMKKAGHQSSNRPERRGRGGQHQNLPEFPDSYFATDDQGNPCLRTEFVSKEKVDQLVRILAKNCQPRLTTGQARRFFNHCREIERRLKVDGESWQQVAAAFESLSFHAQYASSGQNRKIPPEFRRHFIDRNVKRVTSSGAPREAFLKGFLSHFEALIGFGAEHMKDK